MNVLLDNNISPLVARAINVIVEPDGHCVAALRDKFAQDTQDVDWIRALGREGRWLVISGDVHITKRAAERAAWGNSDLLGFFLAPPWSRMRNIEKAGRLLLWWPKILDQANLVAGGALFQLPVNTGSRLKQLKIVTA